MHLMSYMAETLDKSISNDYAFNVNLRKRFSSSAHGFHLSGSKRLSKLTTDRGLGFITGRLGTCELFCTIIRFYCRKVWNFSMILGRIYCDSVSSGKRLSRFSMEQKLSYHCMLTGNVRQPSPKFLNPHLQNLPNYSPNSNASFGDKR